jgi:hypothetical protein
MTKAWVLDIMAKNVLRMIFFVIPVSIFSFSSYGAAPSNWTGEYTYQYVFGHSPGQPAPAWVFDLTIKADGTCELTWEGYQKDEDILCKVSGDEKKIGVYYVSFSDGSTTYPSGYSAYKPGSELFELSSPQNQLITKWKSIGARNALKDGVRFERN